ncbi:MAG TPA: hypothetical protein VKX17_26960 [Planctomycetota bacterium]|nr:hypothetical protein [Planctomycetota bacterium]
MDEIDAFKTALRTYKEKVAAIFTELAGERAKRLRGDKFPYEINHIITMALCEEEVSEKRYAEFDEISFNLTDWSSDAAFLVALHLFPERFTAEEIRAGVHMFLTHAPHHVAEAARVAEEILL